MKQHLWISIVGLMVIALNLVLGVNLIHQQQTNNLFYCNSDPALAGSICEKSYGFYAVNLYLSLPLLALFATLLTKANTLRSVIQTSVFALLWILAVELIVRLFHVPVLYINPLEGRSGLAYTVFETFGVGSKGIVKIFTFLLVSTSIGSALGLLLRYIVVVTLKRRTKN